MKRLSKLLYIIGPTFGSEGMFRSRGYRVATDNTIGSETPDVVAFMGGVDINPKLYDQPRLPITQHPNDARDLREIGLYWRYKSLPKLGICRGAQLINVLNGGSMYQHVDNHGGSNHKVYDVKGREVIVCSVHHQLMRPAKTAEVIAWAEGVSTHRIDAAGRHPSIGKDPEVIWYKEDKALCFQAHPEFGPESCTNYFFDLVNEYIPEARP